MLPVEEHDRSYHIDKGLLPYRDYVMDVVAFTEDKIYSSESTSVKTPEGAPGKAPPNVHMQSLKDNSILVMWDPLPEKYVNGKLQGYLIFTRLYKHEYEWHDDGELGQILNVSLSETHVVLSGLDGGRRYQISVAAFTVDVGPRSEWETVMVGCGGSFYGFFGAFNLTQWDWEARLDCSWTISNAGLSNAVLLISAHEVELRSCEGWVRVFTSEGKEVLHYGGCDPHEYVYGEVVEVSFEGSSHLTIVLHTEHEGSHVRSEFCVLEEGKSLSSAQPSATLWNVMANSTDDGDILVDLTSDPDGQDASFYMIALNKTGGSQYEYGDDDDKPPRYLHMANSSEGVAEVPGLPVYSEFDAVVYRVDNNHDIYSSELFSVQTAEGVPSEGPGHVEYKIVSPDSVYIEWSEISQEHHNGILLGFYITYRAQCSDGEGSSTHAGLFDRSYTITDLQPGTRYDIWIAGFTSRGVGEDRHMDVAMPCGGPRTLTEVNGTIYAPNYPCRYRGPQYCRWSVEPSGPTTAIMMSFENFRLDRDHDSYCSTNDWLGIATGKYNNDTLLCGHDMDRFTLLISGSHVELAFFAREHREGDAFVASYYGLEAGVHEIEVPSWTLSVSNIESTKAEASWEEFPQNAMPAHIEQMFLKISEANKNISLLLPVSEWDRSRHIDNLYPDRKYLLQVVAFTGPGIEHDIYSSDSVSMKTNEGAPSMAPPNVRVDNYHQNSIIVRFEALPQSQHGGDLQGYNVYYKREEDRHDHNYQGEKVTIGPSETQAVIHGLEIMEEYYVWVSAFNSEEGPLSYPQSIVVGCGGMFNQTAALITISKSDWDTRHCVWKIHDNGLENAVLLMSVHVLHYESCGYEYAKVYSEENDFLSYQDCSEVRGEVFELPFGNSRVIISEILIQNSNSYMETELIVLNGGLHSAQSSPALWNISVYSTGDSGIALDWYGYPPDLDIAFFILSVNQTTISPYHDDHDDDDRQLLRILRTFNSSESTFIMKELPAATEFAAVVYIVDKNNEIIKSERRTFGTEEGVPTEGPHVHDWSTNTAERSASFQISPLEERYHGGQLLGYIIKYAPLGGPNNSEILLEVDVDTRRVNLVNLTEGPTYILAIAGFTSKGEGKQRIYAITFCGRIIEELDTEIQSPNYPSTPYIAPDQHDENPQCYWNMRPADPNVSAILITFDDFLIGRREDWGGCSGGVKFYFPGQSEHDDSTGLVLCGRIENLTLLITDNVLNLKAWGFGYHRYDDDYRDGTRFLFDYRAVPGELTTVIGEEIGSWSVAQMTVTNVSITLSWPSPPASFLGDSAVEKYLVIYGWPNRKLFGTQWLPAEQQNTTIDWLDPLTNYTIKVTAILEDGTRGSISWQEFRTTEGVPSQNPYIYWYSVVDYSTIWVKWHRVEDRYIRGTLLGYQVHILEAEYHHGSQPYKREITISDPDQFDFNITGLPPATRFRIWVAAFTSVGEGTQRHEQWIKTKCGSPLYDSEGSISSLGYPDRLEYGDCEWDIHPKNKSVLLFFEHLEIPHSHECKEFYVAVGDDSGVPPKLLCGQMSQFFVLVQAHKVLLLSHAERDIHGGEGFLVFYSALNQSVWEAEPLANWMINTSNVGMATVDAAWPHYSSGLNEELFLYAVVCTPTLREAGPTILTVEPGVNSSKVERLRPYTEYTAQVIALVKIYPGGEISFKGSAEAYFKTDEGVPSKPPGDIKTTTDVGIIRVTWRHVPSDGVNGVLFGYKVFYRLSDDRGDEDNGAQYSEVTVGPTDLQASIEGLINSETYEIRVAGFTKAGVGVVSEAVYARPGCENSVHEKILVLSSPGFPNEYPNDIECYWVFELDLPQFDVVVAIDTFHMETSDGGPNCTNWVADFMGLFNIDPLYVAAGPFCGFHPNPFALVGRGSRNHKSVLYMRTNNGFTFKGFNATYFAVTDTSKINISLDDIQNHEVQITWQVPNDAEEIQEVFVLYKPVAEKEIWNFKKTKMQEATLLPLQPGTEYMLRIVGYSASQQVYASGVVPFFTLAEPGTIPQGFTPTTEPIPRMYPYGSEQGDLVITFKSKCHRVVISNYGGIPVYSKRHRKLNICPPGTIQFERDGINQGPYRFGERPWLRYTPMLAPYWAPTDLGSFIDGPSKVFYHVYQGPDSSAILQKATDDVLTVFSSDLPQGKTFFASWVLVVTWQDIRHQLQNDITRNLHNTFQAVVVTDAIFSFVIYNYPHGGIQYSAPTATQYYKYFANYQRNPVVGVNAGERTGYYKNHQRSGTTGIEAIDNLVGNANIPGRWVYRLEDSNGEEDGDLKCEQWFRNDTETEPSSFSDPPDPCPCTGVQAFFDERYEWVEPDEPFAYCFYTRFASRDGRGRKCCYYTSQERFAALIIGFPGGGTLDRYHKLTPSLQTKHLESDVQPFQYCCKEAQNPIWCHIYFERRPSEGCEEYEPPEWSWLWGDPHIVTLDTGNYTFNGLGEFTMVDVKDGMFQLQARTKLAKGEGTATVFVAAVAKEEDTSTVQVNLKDEGGLEVLVDSEVFQNYSSLTNVSVMLSGSVAVSRPENNSFLVTFPSGISVTVTEIQGSLSIVFAAPTKFKTYTKGLLGTWNGDTLDDYLRPDGTTLPSNATGREIHFDFGLKWQVMSNTSLFTYNPGENTTTFANTSFVPIFLDEPIPFANDALRQEAEEICQGDANCLFDIASTGDTAVGASTKQTSVQLESESQELQNFPPKILVGPSEVNVTINTTATIIVVAEDPNNDSLTFTVTGTLPTGYSRSSNDSSITISWSVTTTKIDIEFIITDGSVNTVLRPVINVCACQNQGICTSVEENNGDSDDDSNDERFNILSCVCQNGYTGDLCETDLDACEENFEPCYPGVTCNDLPPPANETGFQCDPCPSGYSGDGIQCLDDDECALNTDGCDHNCINTPGSFVCTCNSGFFLDLDQKTCQDVDECSPVGDCMHICENTVGSYTCKCNSDFKVDDTDPKKCVPENPCQQDQHGCDHICYQSDGEDKCSCRVGYELNGDGKTCSDIDECTTNQHRCDQSCSDTVGSYTCSCVNGFTLDADGFTCNDVDECLAWTFDCEDESQMCENTYGSYKCVCAEGLYWIDGKCKGLEKGEEPPPPPTAPPPRTPSEEERSQSVNLDVQGLNISEWNQPLEETFKTTLAEVATAHCAENNCQSEATSSRRRRAANYVTFTEDQVHLLPGYPKQISTVPLLASVAFYLQFPPGSSSAVIQKDVLASIVKGSLTKISIAINANITSVEVLIADTTTSASTVHTTYPTEKEESKTMYYIIGGCVAGAVVLLIIVIAAVWCCKRKNGVAKQRVDSEISIEDKGGKMEMDVVNYGYHTETTHHI